MKSVFTALRKVITLSQSEENIIRELMSEKTYPKGHFLIKEEEISDRVFFIIKGLVKEYYLKADIKEVCTRFMAENEFFYCTRSFVDGLPATRFIEAVEDTQVLWLTKSRLEYLYTHLPKTERFVRIATEKYQLLTEDRAELRDLESKEQRYIRFLETHKELSTRIRLKDVASYLDMAAGTLSTIRSKLLTDRNRLM